MAMKKTVLRISILALITVAVTACARPASEATASDADRAAARAMLIVDTHIDLPYRLEKNYEDVAVATETGDFDWPRARAGGLDIAFMSIYIPAEFQVEGGARDHAERLIDMMELLAARHPQKFFIASDSAAARAAAGSNRIALALGMENGAGIDNDLANLDYFYGRGVRYITLTHSKANLISDSSYDDSRPWGGLSAFGESVVRKMNQLGMMVDISHVSDEAFYDVLAISNSPVIASHSSARRFTPGWERNMSDEMIIALAKNGGVIQINFGSAFLTAEANAWSQAYSDARDSLLAKTGWDKSGPEIEAWRKQYRLANPYPFASVEDVLDHIDHVVALVGVEHVGIGSDFDGVGDSLPTGLKDVSALPNLVAGLRARGYEDPAIRKILGENLMRVWSEVESRAAGPGRIAHAAGYPIRKTH